MLLKFYFFSLDTTIDVSFGNMWKNPWQKPTGEKLGYVCLGFRPGAFHRGANVRGAFHLEPTAPIRRTAVRVTGICRYCGG